MLLDISRSELASKPKQQLFDIQCIQLEPRKATDMTFQVDHKMVQSFDYTSMPIVYPREYCLSQIQEQKWFNTLFRLKVHCLPITHAKKRAHALTC